MAMQRTSDDIADLFFASGRAVTVGDPGWSQWQQLTITKKQAAWLFDVADREGRVSRRSGHRYAQGGTYDAIEQKYGSATLKRYLA